MTTTTSANQVCHLDTALDIYFVVDGSGSIGPDNFQKVKDFLKTVISTMSIGENATRVGLIQFSNMNAMEFQLNTFYQKSRVIEAIDRINYLYGNTAIGEAIQFALDEGFSKKSGDRPCGTDVMIVMTDGQDDGFLGLSKPLEEAVCRRIEMYAIGIGEDVDERELRAIAGADSRRMFHVDSFPNLITLIKPLCAQIQGKPMNPCETLPCRNNGTCVPVLDSNKYECACMHGFDGYLCEINIDECASAPCQNNATCHDRIGTFDCECPTEYHGDRCQYRNCTQCALAMAGLSAPYCPWLWLLVLCIVLAILLVLALIGLCILYRKGAKRAAKPQQIAPTQQPQPKSEPTSGAAPSIIFKPPPPATPTVQTLSPIPTPLPTPSPIPMAPTPTPVQASAPAPVGARDEYVLPSAVPVPVPVPVRMENTTPHRILPPADVLFVVDNSGSIGLSNFRQVKSFLKSFTKNIDLDNDRSRLCIVVFNVEAKVHLSFDHPLSPSKIIHSIDSMPYEGHATRLGEALRLACKVTPPLLKSRPSIPKLIVVVSDGFTDDDCAQPIAALKSLGPLIVAVAVRRYNRTLLEQLTDDPRRIFHVRDTSDLDARFQEYCVEEIAKDMVGGGGGKENLKKRRRASADSVRDKTNL